MSTPSRTWPALMAAALVAAVGLAMAPPARALTADEEKNICKEEMISKRGATEVRDLLVRYYSNTPHVYGNADFPDINGLHFRCTLLGDKVDEVAYLVRDPDYENGRAWATERPHGAENEGLTLDEKAMTPPPPNPPSPEFVRVPQ